VGGVACADREGDDLGVFPKNFFGVFLLEDGQFFLTLPGGIGAALELVDMVERDDVGELFGEAMGLDDATLFLVGLDVGDEFVDGSTEPVLAGGPLQIEEHGTAPYRRTGLHASGTGRSTVGVTGRGVSPALGSSATGLTSMALSSRTGAGGGLGWCALK